MTKVNVTNHNLKVLQFLLDAGLISENYLSVTAHICLCQAKTNLEKEMGTYLSQSAFDDAICAEVV